MAACHPAGRAGNGHGIARSKGITGYDKNPGKVAVATLEITMIQFYKYPRYFTVPGICYCTLQYGIYRIPAGPEIYT